MPEIIGKLIGQYLSVVLGLIIIKAFGWFGLGTLAWGAIFAIGLAPVVLTLTFVVIVFVAAFITAGADSLRAKVTK